MKTNEIKRNSLSEDCRIHFDEIAQKGYAMFECIEHVHPKEFDVLDITHIYKINLVKNNEMIKQWGAFYKETFHNTQPTEEITNAKRDVLVSKISQQLKEEENEK